VRKDLGGAHDVARPVANRPDPFEARAVRAGGDPRLTAVGPSKARADPAPGTEPIGPPGYGAAPLADDRNAEPKVPLTVSLAEGGEASAGSAMSVSGDHEPKAGSASNPRAGPGGPGDVARSPGYGAAPSADDRNAEPRVRLNVPASGLDEGPGGRAMGVGGDPQRKIGPVPGTRAGPGRASEQAAEVARPPGYGAAPLAGDRIAEPDVLLDVPTLKVDEISLEVADLRARVSLNAEVLDLLRLHVGADVGLGKVNLGIKGVEAQALLKVRLDNVAAIIKDVLQTIDNNPQLLENITTTVARAVDDVGTAAGRAVGDIGTSTGEAVSGAVRGLTPGIASAATGVGEAAQGLASGTLSATRSAVGNTTVAPSPPLPHPPERHEPASRRPPEETTSTAQHPPAPKPAESGGGPAARTAEADDQPQSDTDGPTDEASGQRPEAASEDIDRCDADGAAQRESTSDTGRRPVQDVHESRSGMSVAAEHPATRPEHPEPSEQPEPSERPEQPEPPEQPVQPEQPEQPGEPTGDPPRPPNPALGAALRELGRAAGRAGLRKLRDLRH